MFFYKNKKTGDFLFSQQGILVSIFGTKELDFCVRHGYRYFLLVIITRNFLYAICSTLKNT